ncbi:MAG TPA: hypothetical protein VGP08_06910 [Pyrinomonadaceae bacterium]|jgi:hypothetical protein|nr:hypothetical protein [Pyrinomonadaceae bacterium]
MAEGRDATFNPYVGPRPFGRADTGIFFGREREVNVISSLVVAHPALLVYGQSGTGKTSLINAQVIPRLNGREGSDVFVARVGGRQPEGVRGEDEGSNVFVFNAITSLREERRGAGRPAGETFADFLRAEPRRDEDPEFPPLRVLIFDQFEELFTSRPERWRDREGFFRQVGDALADDPLLRVVFSMREDYIAQLDPYATLVPERFGVRFRLEQLRQKGALDAVVKPVEALASAGGGRHYAPGVAESLVKDLLTVYSHAEGRGYEGEFVEPVQLQIICHTLWEKLRLGEEVITRAHLEAYGDVDTSLLSFYEDAVRAVTRVAGVKESVLRSWFERTLITPTGVRGVAFRGERETAGLPNRAVDEFEALRIIRAELRDGERWYELSHDRLIEPVREANRQWLLKQSSSVQTLQRLEASAAKWMDTGRDSIYLLSKGEMHEADRLLASPEADELGYSNALRAFIQANHKVHDKDIIEWIKQALRGPGQSG